MALCESIMESQNLQPSKRPRNEEETSEDITLYKIYNLILSSEAKITDKKKWIPILVSFSSKVHKIDFMSKYFSFKKLSLVDIGFESPSRVYCAEKSFSKKPEHFSSSISS